MKYAAVLLGLDGIFMNAMDPADSSNYSLEAFLTNYQVEENRFACIDHLEDRSSQAVAVYSKPLLVRNDSFWNETNDNSYLKVRFHKGIPELLDSLTGREIKMAILSDKADKFTRQIVAENLPHWRFPAIRGVQPSIPNKPDPTVALEIAQILNILPERFIYLGESSTDMKTAIGAGMFPVGALWGLHSAEELKAAGAKTLIKNPMDLMELL